MQTVKVKLVAKMFVKNGAGKYLLMLRSENDTHRPSEWDLPGGSVDQGENPNLAVLREVEEEAGIEVSNIRILTIHSDNTDIFVVRLLYSGDALSENIVLSHEHSAFEWLSLEEILEKNITDKYKTIAQEFLRIT